MMMMTDGRRELEKHARQLPIAASRGQKQDKKMLCGAFQRTMTVGIKIQNSNMGFQNPAQQAEATQRGERGT
jgi:hypothetical protein